MMVTPKSSVLMGFSILFTIHFGVPLFLETPIQYHFIKWLFQWISVQDDHVWKNTMILLKETPLLFPFNQSKCLEIERERERWMNLSWFPELFPTKMSTEESPRSWAFSFEISPYFIYTFTTHFFGGRFLKQKDTGHVFFFARFLPSLKLTARTQKWMFGRHSFPFGARPIVRGELGVSGSPVWKGLLLKGTRFESQTTGPQTNN